MAPAPNWNSKTKTANVAGVSEFAVKKKKNKKINLSQPKSSYVPENPASAAIPASTSNWSAEPDRFVEKSQLEIRAEQEAARRANAPKQKVAAKADFPSLGLHLIFFAFSIFFWCSNVDSLNIGDFYLRHLSL